MTLGISKQKDFGEYEELVKTISSREVAEMMEVKKHSDMLAKIDGLDAILKNGKVRRSDYWGESSYKQDGNGKENREYQVTKKGCELLAHKSTGEKGVLFTVKYMERFNQMEKSLHNPYGHLSQELQAVITINLKQQQLEKRISNIEDNAPLSPSEYGMVSQKISNKIYAIRKELGDNLSRQQKNELYRAINREIKAITGVQHRCQLRQKHLEQVLDFIRYWEPSRATMIVINQMSLDI